MSRLRPSAARAAAVSTIILVALAALAVAPGCGGTGTAPTVITTFTSPTQAGTAGTPDWANYGFAVIGTQNISAAQGGNVTAGNYVFQIPPGAFTGDVKFEVLSADSSSYNVSLPAGQVPVLIFALRVTDPATGYLVGTFEKPIMLTAKSTQITPASVYYTIGADGTVMPRPEGMTVQAGQLDHPVAGAVFAWVISSPAAGGTSTGAGGAATTGGTSTGGY